MSVIPAALVLSCATGVEDDGRTENVEGPLCAVPETTSQTVKTTRAGTVNTCSEAWVAATGNPACLSEADCAASGRACVKEPGRTSTRCVTPCGDGTLCPPGSTCLECEDSEPHCSSRSSCPEPRYPMWNNGTGEQCPQWVSSCERTSDCCSSLSGNATVCSKTSCDFKTAGTSDYWRCREVCTSQADCDDDECCLPADSDDDQYCGTVVDGAPNDRKVCWTRGIYDFCKALPTSSGGGGGSGGDDGGFSYSDCVQTCYEAGGSNCGDTCK